MESEENKIVLETPIIRAGSIGPTTKQEDSVLNKTKWTQPEVDLLVKIIDYYLETRHEQSDDKDSISVPGGSGLGVATG